MVYLTINITLYISLYFPFAHRPGSKPPRYHRPLNGLRYRFRNRHGLNLENKSRGESVEIKTCGFFGIYMIVVEIWGGNDHMKYPSDIWNLSK